MSSWVRLWHDMPTDPKWRVIARKSGQSVGNVIAVFTFLMVSASANANERGRTQDFECEDCAAALDLECDAVEAIIQAMTGKVIDKDGMLTGWEKRQPKREDSSAERAKAWRDERKRTQANASERPETDADTDTEITTNVVIARIPKSKAVRFVPADWMPNAKHEETALSEGMTREQMAYQDTRFREHEFKKPITNVDLAFHRWIRTAKDFGNGNARTDAKLAARHENYRASWAGSEQAADILAARRNL
jgi:hypothetical protein